MTERNQFHTERRSGIGGSDAAAALGLSPWRTPYDLWAEKVGEGKIPAITEPMRWGSLLEPTIAGEYSRRTGRRLYPQEAMLRHPDYRWMIAHLDGRVIPQTSADAPRIVEIKTARIAEGWGEPGSDEVPLGHLIQVHHYMTVSGAEFCDVAVLIAGVDFRLYEVRADAAIAKELIEREAAFWQRVETRDPPAPVNAADAVTRWGRLAAAGRVTAGYAEVAAIDSLRQIREERAELDAAEDHAKSTVLQALGERGDTLVGAHGELLASWKLDNGRKAYTVEARPPARRFLLKG